MSAIDLDAIDKFRHYTMVRNASKESRWEQMWDIAIERAESAERERDEAREALRELVEVAETTEREHYAQRRISQLEDAVRWACHAPGMTNATPEVQGPYACGWVVPTGFQAELLRRAGLKEEGK